MIGVYDSGLGGLSVLMHLRRIAPQADLIYLGDTAHLPYGDKSRGELLRYARGAVRLLESEGVSAILVACGTVSTTLLASGELVSAVPLLGTVAPAVAEIARLSPRRLLLLATAASVGSGEYARQINRILPSAALLQVACPSLVPLIEAGRTAPTDPLLQEALDTVSSEASHVQPDAILLGCTHYALLAPAIARRFPRAALIDCGLAAAQATAPLLSRGQGTTRYLVTGDPDTFHRAASRITSLCRKEIRRVRIRTY